MRHIVNDKQEDPLLSNSVCQIPHTPLGNTSGFDFCVSPKPRVWGLGFRDGLWKGCKPNFVCPEVIGGENHLSQQPVPGTLPPEREVGAGRSVVPYLALHPMGFSVPPGSRPERWALTPPFHPYHRPCKHGRGGLFSVALSVGTPHGVASPVYPRPARVTRHRALWRSDVPPSR